MAEENTNQVTLIGEEGEEERFTHILTFLHEGERYVALTPESEADSDEEEVVLLQIVSDNGEDTYVSIDNEVLLNEVFEDFLELMDEQDDEE